MTVNLDWENLGFSYMKLPYRFLVFYCKVNLYFINLTISL